MKRYELEELLNGWVVRSHHSFSACHIEELDKLPEAIAKLEDDHQVQQELMSNNSNESLGRII